MANMKEVKCENCSEIFHARVADRKRGWGKYCSKSCKATAQTRNKNYRKGRKNNFEIGRPSSGVISTGEDRYECCYDFD